ncbi:hypothetical protein AMAG_09056 [Allomyces macrogynus ATCC 38327]|uniref:Cap-specific mRNA (nucleoside-2'-O-)-methyltransferase 1 n=1 Tax=Allomyces macrogynus (strain ATCC 38327) TaxID=578462 RepID=A0A0L0SNN8_ALLM3|nr:hypothetical protein AMAG_09056 [Allomyces macrogynus ATCC 38327]|eukprot:KNE63995.1 hypothetical protein AMAG_09056 [Allomyces macrogynus ATCC 38327]
MSPRDIEGLLHGGRGGGGGNRDGRRDRDRRDDRGPGGPRGGGDWRSSDRRDAWSNDRRGNGGGDYRRESAGGRGHGNSWRHDGRGGGALPPSGARDVASTNPYEVLSEDGPRGLNAARTSPPRGPGQLPPQPRMARTGPSGRAATLAEINWLTNGPAIREFMPVIEVVEDNPPPMDVNMFSDTNLVNQVLELKSQLQSVTHEDITRGRALSNPYEKVGKSVFINRAAVKLAELDAECGLVPSLVRSFDPAQHAVVMADICSGPGGFSEYLLWRTFQDARQDVTAIGFTLNSGDENTSFTPHKFVTEAIGSERFATCYGVPRPDAADGTGDGDILNLDNIHALAAEIDRRTNGAGAALVASDGGISVVGHEDQQEALTRHLKLCEVLAMFHVLACGGSFVLKIYDALSPFMAGLVYLLFAHFEHVAVVKPLSSRPANSERYVICKHLLTRKPAAVISHLEAAHDRLAKGENVTEIVSLFDLIREEQFRKYLRHVNMVHAANQVRALEKLVEALTAPVDRAAPDHGHLVRSCLQQWRLPPTPRGGSA